MAMSLFVLLFGLVMLAGFVFWLVMLVDALRVPADRWAAAGQNQLLYVLLLIFLGFIGALVYLLVARPQLKAVAV